MEMMAQLCIFFFKEDPVFQFCSNGEFSLETDVVLHGNGQAENHRPEKTTELASFGCFSSVFHTIYFFHLTCFLFHFEGRLLIQSDELLPCKLCLPNPAAILSLLLLSPWLTHGVCLAIYLAKDAPVLSY